MSGVFCSFFDGIRSLTRGFQRGNVSIGTAQKYP
jgi:hypothetical protein